MARVRLAPEVVDQNFERFIGHLLEHGIDDAASRIDEIVDALAVLRHSPLIGRRVVGGLRELVIGRGSRGHVARYEYDAGSDSVVVYAMRAQHEGDYRR